MLFLFPFAAVGQLRPERKKMNRNKTKLITFSGLALGLAYTISFFPLYRWPQGGSVTMASMLPVMLVGICYGLRPGLLAGFAYSLLQFIQDPWFLTPLQFLLDYPLAFMCLGLAGLAAGRGRRYACVILTLAGVARFFCHLVSGAIFFANYAPAGMNPWWYSLTVNGLVQGTELAICLVAMSALMATGAWDRIVALSGR
jgi:thiamine transporter